MLMVLPCDQGRSTQHCLYEMQGKQKLTTMPALHVSISPSYYVYILTMENNNSLLSDAAIRSNLSSKLEYIYSRVFGEGIILNSQINKSLVTTDKTYCSPMIHRVSGLLRQVSYGGLQYHLYHNR
jgi:hypothetical protein